MSEAESPELQMWQDCPRSGIHGQPGQRRHHTAPAIAYSELPACAADCPTAP